MSKNKILYITILICIPLILISLSRNYFDLVDKSNIEIKTNNILLNKIDSSLNKYQFPPSLDTLGYRALVVTKNKEGKSLLKIIQRNGTEFNLSDSSYSISNAPVLAKDGLSALFISNKKLFYWNEAQGVSEIANHSLEGKWSISSVNAEQFLLTPLTSKAKYQGECNELYNDTCSSILLLTAKIRKTSDDLISGANEIVRDFDIQPYIKNTNKKDNIDLDNTSDFILFEQTNSSPIWRIANTKGFNNSNYKVSNKSFEYLSFQVGSSSSIPVSADYNGDGYLDIATFKMPAKQSDLELKPNWEIYLSGNTKITDTAFFNTNRQPKGYIWSMYPGEIPVPADYDCDGKTDIATYNPHVMVWKIMLSSGGFNEYKAKKAEPGFGIINKWGQGVPVVGDYNGDGCSDIAVWELPVKEKYGVWKVKYLDRVGNEVRRRSLRFGQKGDIPVPADYNGDGVTDIAFYRPSTFEWIIRYSKDNIQKTRWGFINFDMPIPKDYDGDNKADFAFYNNLYERNQWMVFPSSKNPDAMNVVINGQGVVSTYSFGSPKAYPQEVWLSKLARRQVLSE